MSNRPIRETDRLIQILAWCVKHEDESQKDAERELRTLVARERLAQGKPEVVLLREMWQRFKKAHAHKDVNTFIADGYLPVLSFKSHEEHVAVLKRFHKRARLYLKLTKLKQSPIKEFL